ncbi:MAG: LytR C-terminal domain-containing protein [Bacteroidota bacterium]
MADRTRFSDALLNVALGAVVLLVGVLLVGLVSRTFSPRTTPTRDAALALGERPGSDPIQVEIRNAAGVDGIARQTAAYLRRRGFDVIEFGNASAARDTSAVVIRAGTDDYARRVAAALDLSSDHIESGGALVEYDADVAVYLGADYSHLAPFQGTSTDSTD